MKNKIIVALDTDNKRDTLRLVKSLLPLVKIFKIGSVLFTRYGPEIIKEVKNIGGGVFLDLKFHDIPQVVFRAVKEASEIGVDMLTVHTLGGEEMLRMSIEAVYNIKKRPKILGVTILTSLEDNGLKRLGIEGGCVGEVRRLSRLAVRCGLDGVVASAREVRMLRKILPASFTIVTPGIRPEGYIATDQKRILSPREAIKAGSDYLVIGRPVTMARKPIKVIEDILMEING